MESRLANKEDLDAIMELVRQAKLFMRSIGLDQWQDDYPQRSDFLEDIEKKRCYVFSEGDDIAAVIAVTGEPEECYERVYGGSWLTQGTDYAVVHRSTVSDSYRGRGLAGKILLLAEELAASMGKKSLRVDTHRENAPMRRSLEKIGYTYCGWIFLDESKNPRLERVIYEKNL